MRGLGLAKETNLPYIWRLRRRYKEISHRVDSGIKVYSKLIMAAIYLLLALVLATVAYLIVPGLLLVGKRAKGLPPGPPTFPIIGNLHLVR